MKTIEEKAKEVFPLTKDGIQKRAEQAVPILKFIGTGMDWNFRERFYYIQGATEINAVWQEKIRWIPVEEKLPEYVGKTLHIIAINKVEGFFKFCAFDLNAENNNIEGFKKYFTHWREIIE